MDKDYKAVIVGGLPKSENIPEYQLQRLAEPLIEIVSEYFKRPGVQEKYEKWLAEREAKQTNNK